MRYRTMKISNIDEFLTHGVGSIGLTPIWELHSVVPSMTRHHADIAQNIEVIQWLVILKTDDETVQHGA